MNKNEIIDALMAYLDMNNKEFAEFLGVKPSTISTWKSRNTIDYDLVFAKCNFVNAAWLLTGEGSMLKESPSVESPAVGTTGYMANLMPAGTLSAGVPFYNLPVSAGHSTVDIIGTSTPDGYITSLPGAELAQAILPVIGMSMQPEIMPGALIGIRNVSSWESLNTERIYMIITRDDRMIKRIEHDPDNTDILWCISPNYQKFKIFKSDIIEIHRVCFVYNTK